MQRRFLSRQVHFTKYRISILMTLFLKNEKQPVSYAIIQKVIHRKSVFL